jgi:hypothetical protein
MKTTKLGLMGLMGLMLFGCGKHDEPVAKDDSKLLRIELQRARAEIDRLKMRTESITENEENYRKIVRITSRLANSPNYPGGGEDESWMMWKVQIPMRDRLYKTFGEEVVDHWTKYEIERVFGAMQAK